MTADTVETSTWKSLRNVASDTAIIPELTALSVVPAHRAGTIHRSRRLTGRGGGEATTP